MKRSFMMTLALLCLCGTTLAQNRFGRSRERDRSGSSSYSNSSHSDTGEYAQDYAVFDDLNIFVRERHIRRPQNTDTRPQRSLEQTYVLTGIVQDDNGTYHANFENLSGGDLMRVNVGNPLAHGKIAEIQQDQVAYEANGSRTWVQIGSNLTGSDGGVSDDSSGGGGGPAVDPNAPGLTTEQRMRARRQQQMNGGSSAPSTSVPSRPASTAAPATPPNVYNGPAQTPLPTGAAGTVTAQPNGDVNVVPPNAAATPVDPNEPTINHNFPQLPPNAPPPANGE